MGRPRVTVLSDDEVESIHLSSIDVLEHVGMIVPVEETLGLLKNAGADVDFDHKLVKFPEYLVQECLNKAPSTIRLYDRKQASYVELGCGKPPVYMSGDGVLYVHDLETGERRRGTLRDHQDMVRLVDALENIQTVGGEAIDPVDVPTELSKLHMWAAAFENTSKHVTVYQGNGLESADAIRMASIITGGQDELRRKPIISFMACLPQVLCFERGFLEGLIQTARHGIPVIVHSGGMASATCPATLAGTLVQCNAEVLGGITVTEIINPGAPVIYLNWGRTFDAKAENVSLCSPEFALLRIAIGQLAEFYNLPSSSMGWTADSKILDVQAGWEMFATFISAMTAANHLAGTLLDGGAIADFAALVIHNELAGIAERMFRGIEVSPDTLAVQVIGELGAGPGHNYMSTRHTREHYRKEQWLGYKISERRKWESWKAEGGASAYHKARDEAKRILATHVPEPLPADIQREIDAMLVRKG